VQLLLQRRCHPGPTSQIGLQLGQPGPLLDRGLEHVEDLLGPGPSLDHDVPMGPPALGGQPGIEQ
jgi:hypothetical protein